MALNGVVNGGIAAFNKADKINGIRTTSRWALRPAAVGTNVLTGGLAAVPAHYVNKATNSMSSALANYYGDKDQKATAYHTALVGVPAALGGIYTLGTITHSLDKTKDMLKSKSLKEAGKHLVSAINPVKHVERGFKETGGALRDLATLKKIGLGKRGFAALNVLRLN